MLRAWRLIKKKHAKEALSGEGSRLYGGRWNSKGLRVIYAAESLSLATLEVIVHLQFYAALKNFVCLPIDFESTSLKTVNIDDLPENWREDPIPLACRSFGDKWIEKKDSLILKIPSVIIPVDNNYLINPDHPDFNKLTINPLQNFELDKRLIK